MPEPKSRKWTADELRRLRRLARTTPLSEIAAQLNRTVQAVRTKAAHERLTLDDDCSSRGPARQSGPWERPDSQR